MTAPELRDPSSRAARTGVVVRTVLATAVVGALAACAGTLLVEPDHLPLAVVVGTLVGAVVGAGVAPFLLGRGASTGTVSVADRAVLGLVGAVVGGGAWVLVWELLPGPVQGAVLLWPLVVSATLAAVCGVFGYGWCVAPLRRD